MAHGFAAIVCWLFSACASACACAGFSCGKFSCGKDVRAGKRGQAPPAGKSDASSGAAKASPADNVASSDAVKAIPTEKTVREQLANEARDKVLRPRRDLSTVRIEQDGTMT